MICHWMFEKLKLIRVLKGQILMKYLKLKIDIFHLLVGAN